MDERRIPLAGPMTLMPGMSVSLYPDAPDPSFPIRRRIRVTGGTVMPDPHACRGEEAFRLWEHLLDDSLTPSGSTGDLFIQSGGAGDSLTPLGGTGDLPDPLDRAPIGSGTSHFVLHFSGKGEVFARKAFRRISDFQGKGLSSANGMTIRVPLERRMLTEPGHFFGLELELYQDKPGRSPHDTYDEPDGRLRAAVPDGDGPAVLELHVPPEEGFQVAAIVLVLGGTGFTGSCTLSSPTLVMDGLEMTFPFFRQEDCPDPFDAWVGMNLCTRNWPTWKLESKGAMLFQDAVFDRASDVADFQIPLPRDEDSGMNDAGSGPEGAAPLILTLVADPVRANFPYRIERIDMMEIPCRDFEVISRPPFLQAGTDFGLLVETNRPDVTLNVTAEGPVQLAMKTAEGLVHSAMQTAKGLVQPAMLIAERSVCPAAQSDDVPTGNMHFPMPGFHVLAFHAKDVPGAVARVLISDGTRTETIEDILLLENDPNPVRISTGDEIYLDMKEPDYADYFRWFIRERVGNFYQFRPSYQWSGLRYPEPDILSRYLSLLQELHIPYAWQVEGRELAGDTLNPPASQLASPLFHGKQAHENDGGYYYWRHFRYKGFFSDIAARNRPYGGIFAKHRPIYTDHGTFIHYDPFELTSMAEGASRFVENLKYSKGESTRHTGPSTLFRYLYQAGYDWLGAEQMYGPEAVILSALRGASRAYGKTDYGSLHAMQWGSFPFTAPEHARRHYLSLAVAYMNGSSHLNTEEGLWTDEWMNDRFTEAGRAHRDAQKKMLDYAETHRRRGTQVCDIAVLLGRNDGWKCFGRTNLWSMEGDAWRFGPECGSFDLLRIFHPDCILDACGPEGWFSATPYGAIDLLPIEAGLSVLRQYRTLIFLGWNSYDSADFERLSAYVAQGGTLILTAAHLNRTPVPFLAPCAPDGDTALEALLGPGFRGTEEEENVCRYQEENAEGGRCGYRAGNEKGSCSENQEENAEGNPPAYRIRSFGSGKVIFFPEACYPADEKIRGDYESVILGEARTACLSQERRGWISENASSCFTAWDSQDRRTLYLLDINWHSDSGTGEATLHLNGRTFPIVVRRGELETIHCAGTFAVQPEGRTTDVLAMHEIGPEYPVRGVMVQTTGTDRILLFDALSGEMRTIDLDHAGRHEVFFFDPI